VIAKKAIPEATVQCLVDSLLGKGAAGSGSGGSSGGCAADGGVGGSSGSAGGTGGWGTGGSGTGGSGTGGSGTGGTAGGDSCAGMCGSATALPSGCYCDALCETVGDCCGDFESSCHTSCTDPGSEPNDTKSNPIVVADSVNCFPIESHAFAGVIAGVADSEWFRLDGPDVCANGSGGLTNPLLALNTVDPGIVACVFHECAVTENKIFSCGAGSFAVNAPDGTPGCCATGGDVRFDLACTSGTTLTTFWVFLSTTDAACHPFQVDFTHEP
jgi:hypothetical protein